MKCVNCMSHYVTARLQKSGSCCQTSVKSKPPLRVCLGLRTPLSKTALHRPFIILARLAGCVGPSMSRYQPFSSGSSSRRNMHDYYGSYSQRNVHDRDASRFGRWDEGFIRDSEDIAQHMPSGYEQPNHHSGEPHEPVDHAAHRHYEDRQQPGPSDYGLHQPTYEYNHSYYQNRYFDEEHSYRPLDFAYAPDHYSPLSPQEYARPPADLYASDSRYDSGSHRPDSYRRSTPRSPPAAPRPYRQTYSRPEALDVNGRLPHRNGYHVNQLRASPSPVAPPLRPPSPLRLPSPGYLELSETVSTTAASSPTRKLLILDLNGTLLIRSGHRPGKGRVAHPRPYMPSFRRYLFCTETTAWLDVMIWSSAQPHNVADMVRSCFLADQEKLVAIWGRDTLGLSEQDYCTNVSHYNQTSFFGNDTYFVIPL